MVATAFEDFGKGFDVKKQESDTMLVWVTVKKKTIQNNTKHYYRKSDLRNLRLEGISLRPKDINKTSQIFVEKVIHSGVRFFGIKFAGLQIVMPIDVEFVLASIDEDVMRERSHNALW